jgi:hypothetical protein
MHETTGQLVEVHPDRIRLLKSNGRYSTVRLDRLSRDDQAYVAAIGARLAAERSTVQAPADDTAGL